MTDNEPTSGAPDPGDTDRTDSDPTDTDPTDTDPTDTDPTGSDQTDGRVTDNDKSDGGSDGPRRRSRLSSAGAVIGLLVGLLAFALVVQVQSNTGDTQLENARQDDLVRILSDLNSRELRLRSDISNYQSTLDQLNSGAQGADAALTEARRRADELGILSGTIPAQGEGLTIQLVPGTDQIRAATVLETIEELRGAGAEVMQIGGSDEQPVRIIASTYFVDTARGISVDGAEVTGTYTITVIGPGNTMRTALTIPGGVSDSVGRDGGTVVVDGPGMVKISATHPAADLQHAKPAE